MIDLHCHSCFSDGIHSPAELIDKAVQANLSMLALTDHDTVEGVYQLLQQTIPASLKIIPGIEISTRWKKYDIHILGLNIDPHNKNLLETIKQQTVSRWMRSEQIAERLEKMGVENALAKAKAIAGHERIGRPHFAELLVQEQKAHDHRLAFKQILGRGKPAYVVTSWISIEEAIAVINDAGGIAVIAHPNKYQLTRSKLHELITYFKEYGGQGLEVVSGEINTTEAEELAGLCVRYNLLASSGSDFHAQGFSRVSLGKQRPLPITCIPVWQQWNN